MATSGGSIETHAGITGISVFHDFTGNFETHHSGTRANGDHTMDDPFAVRSTRDIGEIIDAE